MFQAYYFHFSELIDFELESNCAYFSIFFCNNNKMQVPSPIKSAFVNI